MPRYIAFLRAINVGGHIVKMDHLRQIFESLGFLGVDTFIASGNVIFESAVDNAEVLKVQIENKLQDALGYEVATFIRRDVELNRIANEVPFEKSDLDSAMALNVAFLAESLDDETIQKIMALRTEIDDFHVREREVYWLCRRKQSESTFSNSVLEKTLGRASTLRGVNTLKKLVGKLVGLGR
jgi:uncharacterized protein (DUF1697 family)